MLKTLLILSTITLCLFSCGTPSPKQEAKSERIVELEANIQQIIDESELVGAGVGIVNKGKVQLLKGFGFSNISKKTTYSENTIQPLGSVSKTFVGVAIVKAIELGYFNLETKINDILPFPIVNPYHPNEDITIFHLVTHTSGIQDSESFWSNCYFIRDTTQSDLGTNYIKRENLAKQGPIPSLEKLITNYFKQDAQWYSNENFVDNSPGEYYEYSNVGSSLAAYLIEQKAGMSFKDFCRNQIFKPLKLKSTAWQEPKDIKRNAVLYLDKNNPIPTYQLSSYPDGGLHSTPKDLTSFLLEMIKGYTGNSTFLKAESYQLLFERKFDVLPTNYPKETNGGIFWDWMKNGRLGHNGADPGLFTFISFDPDKESGLVILLNRNIVGTEDWKKYYKSFYQIRQLIYDYESE